MDVFQAAGWVAAPVMAAVIGTLAGMLRESRERERRRDEVKEAEHAALCMGMCEEMRSKLYAMHERYVVNGESMPYHEKERADHVYSVYHALGGNGTGTHVYEELMAAYVGGGKGTR